MIGQAGQVMILVLMLGALGVTLLGRYTEDHKLVIAARWVSVGVCLLLIASAWGQNYSLVIIPTGILALDAVMLRRDGWRLW